MSDKAQQIKEALTRGVENIYPKLEVLEKALKSDKKLRIYNGIDPTGKLHIGHGVQLLKLRQFQDLGHDIIVLIGDFIMVLFIFAAGENSQFPRKSRNDGVSSSKNTIKESSGVLGLSRNAPWSNPSLI